MFATLVMMQSVDDSCRYNKCTSKEEVCKITNPCCHSSHCYKMHQNFYHFDQDTCDRSHCEGSYQYRNLREIQLIEGWCQEWEREFKIH